MNVVFLFDASSSKETTNHSKQLKKQDPKTTQKTRNGGDRYRCRKWGREMAAVTMGAQISANFVPPIPAFPQPNLTHKKLKKPDLERKSKGKIKKKKKTKKTLRGMGSSAVVVVRLGLLVVVRWLGRRSRTGDGEPRWLGFGRKWRTHSGLAGS
jgi:uncharacterized sporulation protein YeaH/YhbH (DUF444 family)